MKKIAIKLVILGAGLTVMSVVGIPEPAPGATGHWEGRIQIPNHELRMTVDLARSPNGG